MTFYYKLRLSLSQMSISGSDMDTHFLDKLQCKLRYVYKVAEKKIYIIIYLLSQINYYMYKKINKLNKKLD